MEKFIEVVDNFLPQKLEDILEHHIIYETKYLYSYNIVTGNKEGNYNPGFGCGMYDRGSGFDDSKFFPLSVLYNFSSFKGFFITNIYNAHIFFQVPSITQTLSTPHVDMLSPHWVLLYYVNDSDGDTILYNKNKEEIKRVSPKKGKAIFFDGSIYHSAGIPKNSHRAVINFNFIGKKL